MKQSSTDICIDEVTADIGIYWYWSRSHLTADTSIDELLNVGTN